ncbi:MAG TPA: AzlD domain-containing protein [Acidimicrobiales bacterium]|nr:AzlD domain-containing protein [Acidimicrobiales bacterium]
MSQTTAWVVVISTSVACFSVKLLGYYIPAGWLAHPRLQRVNALVPIALLSALVVAEGLVEKTRVVIDHRLAGLCVALALLLAKAPFPVVVVGAAVASAILYHLH